ncbi:MAG: nucleoside monophosphate kinase [bacterium]
MKTKRHEAVLIVGPTGSGKTPLGEFLEQGGLWGRCCVHFDFGANLRRIGEGKMDLPSLTQKEWDVVLHSLRSGALLENRHFAIAEKILKSFIEQNKVGERDIILLNGLPRHVGQAESVDIIIRIRLIVSLDCSKETVRDRIRRNTGGDRTHRIDDSLSDIEKKLIIFHERTIPLFDHYRVKNVRIMCINIAAETTPEDIRRLLVAVECPFHRQTEISP